MIVSAETVEQVIDRGRRGLFLKEIIATDGPDLLAMVRKRRLVRGPDGLSAVEDAPKGPLLLVHGFGQNRYTWHVEGRSFSAFLAEQGWDVFNVDLRGHGRSRALSAARPNTLSDHVHRDVPTCAREAMGLAGRDGIFLIGHSMGGLISYSVAATELRDQVRGIVSIGSPYRFGIGSRTLNAVSALLGAVHSTGLLDDNPTLPVQSVGRHLRRRQALWDSKWLPVPVRAWLPGSVEEEVLGDYLMRAFDPTSLGVARDLLRRGESSVFRGRDGQPGGATAFEQLDLPLLVVAGTRDSLAPPASVYPAVARSRSSDKTYREYALGHIDLIVGREAPGTVWPTIAAWLDRHEAQPS